MPRDREEHKAPKTGSDLFKESLYGKLTTPEALEETERAKAAEKKKGKFLGHENFYFWLCSVTQKHFVKKKSEKYLEPEAVESPFEPQKGKKKKKKQELSKNYREALDFLGWKIDEQVVMAVPRTAGILALIIGVIIAGVMYSFLSYTPQIEAGCPNGICDDMRGEDARTCPQDCDPTTVPGGIIKHSVPASGPSPMVLLFIMFIPVFLTLGLITYVKKYPLNAADAEKMRALTYVPEITNYMIMQMRLQPNLERAIEFAAEHGEGRIAEEFRDLLWGMRVRKYDSIEEALDNLAYRWEPYSEEFKHAITMIRSSVLVPSDLERNIIYDKTIDDLLDTTKEKMELYAHSMKQPSMYLFYIAILLPLMIIIMLPVAAAFAGMPVASTPILFLLYIIVMPLITYVYARMVLSKRPGGYVPPEIPDDHPDLPKKGTAKIAGMRLPIVATTVMVLIAVLSVGLFMDSAIKMPDQKIRDLRELNPGKDIQQPTILQYILPLAVALPLGFYLFAKSVNKRQIQEKIFKMELDFKDAMYLMASRLGEKKPLEDAITYVKRFMPESKVATELLDNVERNVMVLGLTLKSAIFDPVYGAMRNVHSRLMNSAFKIMTDSIELGPEVASTSLISVSNQIRNIQRINDLMRKLLDEVTGMMESMARFIAPVVLGIVASLQQVIIKVIAPLSKTTASATTAGADRASAAAISSAERSFAAVSPDAIRGMATPFEFQLIVAFYVVMLVIILSYFAGKVRYGDNKVAIMMTMGTTLPVAVGTFIAALYLGGLMVGGLAG